MGLAGHTAGDCADVLTRMARGGGRTLRAVYDLAEMPRHAALSRPDRGLVCLPMSAALAHLRQLGIDDPMSELRRWARRGYTETDTGYSTKRLRVLGTGRGGRRLRCVAFRRSAVLEALDNDRRA